MVKYKLEKRTCICGCQRTFKTLPTSHQRVASAFECTTNLPNGGRLEFTGTTDQATKKAKRDNPYQTDRKKKVSYSRNPSKWDKKPND